MILVLYYLADMGLAFPGITTPCSDYFAEEQIKLNIESY